MDPSTNPPAATEPPGTAEPPAHVAHAANATSPHASNNHSHPPYAEMIAAAITALKEKNGSSRQAIAKYIEKAYANLPSTHSALLTHHLKRLKNGGHLEMVKHSYTLPRSVPLSSTTTGTGNSNPSSPGPKRGPGRPPKAMMEAQPNKTESVLVSLGLVDGPAPVAKRGPGRPPKAKTGLVGTELCRAVGFKRGRGRPPRPKLLSLLMEQSGPKRRAGRPPRTGPIGSPGLPRPRGRPKKGGSVMKAAGRPRGRPPKNAVAAVAVKFDPSDQEIIEHLEAKVSSDAHKLHPLIDEFIPTLEGENGICYTHPEKLPGVSKDGLIRHFFHRPSKAYTTGTRKRRKVHTEADGGETRWHKTGKTRPVFVGGAVKGFKKILVLYTNYGRQRKPEKTNWVMHQYHLGDNEEEKDGELVVSKVFYQTQPRQCGSSLKDSLDQKSRSWKEHHSPVMFKNTAYVEYYNNPPLMAYEIGSQNRESPPQLIPNLVLQGDGSSFIHLPTNASKGKVLERK